MDKMSENFLQFRKIQRVQIEEAFNNHSYKNFRNVLVDLKYCGGCAVLNGNFKIRGERVLLSARTLKTPILKEFRQNTIQFIDLEDIV